MAVTDYKFIESYDMTGGINTVSSAIALKQNEFRDAQDIDYFPIGGWSKRNGYDALNDVQVGSEAGTGLYMARYSTAGGTNIAYMVSGTKFYSMSAALAGTWTDATNGLTITTGNNNIWNFDILNNIVMGGNGVDTPIQISSAGTATAFTAAALFTTYRFAVQARGYMWYFVPTVGGTVQYERGYFSDLNDPTTVGTNNFVNVFKGQGGIVTGGIEFKTYFFVWKRHGIFQLIYQPTQVNSSGTIFPWIENPNPIVPGVGTQSHRSIVKFTTPSTHLTPGQEYIFFIDQFGMPRIFDGATTLSFSSKIGSSRDTAIKSMADMDKTRTQYAHSVNYASKNKILFWLSDSSSVQDTPWVLDYSTGFSIGRYKYFLPFNVSAMFEKSDGTFKPYASDYSGKVYQLDEGTTDDGAPINDYAVIGDKFVDSPSIRSKWHYIDIRGLTGDTDQQLKISYYVDGDDTPSFVQDPFSLQDAQTLWGASQPMTWGVSNWSKKMLQTKTSEINLVSKTLRTKIESYDKTNDTYSIEGFSLAVEPLGTDRT